MTAIPMPSLDECWRLDVDAQLRRILANELFVSSERSAGFLRYIVEETLAGRAAEIKELVIAVDVYGRASTYDPKRDSTVRVEATRLRARLERYYARRGGRDPIRITIPKGTYVPQFVRVGDPPAPAGVNRSPSAPATGTRIDVTPRLAPRSLNSLGALALVAIFVTVWIAVAGRTGALDARIRDRASTPAPDAATPESLAAWREGYDLLRLDPHTSATDRGVPRTLARAIERYEYAVAQSPRFARGWASVAEAREYAFAFVGREPEKDARLAEEAARRAVALDPNLPDAHAMLALVRFYLRWDFTGAEAAYRRAIQLDPRAAWAIVEFADLLRETRRLDEALALIRRSRALQPALPVLAIKEAELLLAQGRPDAAIETANAAIALKRDSPKAHVALGAALEAKGDEERALVEYRRALALDARDRRALPALGSLLGRLGRRAEALEILQRLEDLHARVRVCAYQIAVVHVGLGEADRALDWLERAFTLRQMHLPFMAVEPRFDSLRGQPRFEAILARVNLPRH